MATNSSRIRGNVWHAASPLAWIFVAHGLLVAAAAFVRKALSVVRHEALKDGIYLVPVRVFIGIGWLRAFVEKAIDLGWRDGTRLVGFLQRQLGGETIVFPPYQALLTDIFLPHAMVLGWIIMLGQLLAGLAIASGTLTTAALLGGIFMNLNFLLAGATDPSTFYIVIQVVLLMAGAGAILGVDALLAAHGRFPLLAARPPGLQPSLALPAPTGVVLAILACGIAVYATAQIRDWSPAGSVRDPAAILAVLAYMTASWATIAALRGDRNPPAAQSRLVRPRA
jgi:thiosulfate dehydrogenase [quinone] large subunit